MAEFASLDDAVVDRTVRWFDQQAARGRVGVGVLVRELRSGGRKAGTPDLKAQAEYGQKLVSRLEAAMPEMVVDGQAHPAAVLALMRGMSTPGAVRRFVRAWIVEHEQQPGAAYETRDAAHWWSVVNPQRGVAA